MNLSFGCSENASSKVNGSPSLFSQSPTTSCSPFGVPLTSIAFTFPSLKSPEVTADPFICLDFMVEKKSNRVLFAESDKDFVDILFSFLTLPIGSIVKMTKELPHSTPIGCMNNIHKSVENLDTKFFMPKSCKDLLISPGRSSEPEYNNLKLKIGVDLESSKLFYFCANSDCRKVTKRLSEFPNVPCDCGQLMTQSAKKKIIHEEHADINGVFIKGVTDMFLISDDLQVMAGSGSQCLSLLKSSGIADAKELETQSITIRSHEVLQLLQLTMVSKTPLTDLIRLKKCDFNAPKLHLENAITELPVANSDTSKSKLISLKLFISKSKGKVLYAECGEDFVDFLFSFLTFPLGSIVKLLDTSSSVIAIDNVYRSVKELDSEHYIKSDRIKNTLINPNLSPFHGCENQLLGFEEASFPLFCFIKGPSKFMVTDELDIMPLSAISSVLILAKLNILISDVDTMVIDVGKEETLSLLKAALVSETPLSDLYKQKWKKVAEEVNDSGP